MPTPLNITRMTGTPGAHRGSAVRPRRPMPAVDDERGDVWAVSSRRAWAMAEVEDCFRRGWRIMVRGGMGDDIRLVTLSPRGLVIYRAGKSSLPLAGAAPYIISDALAVFAVTRYPLDRLYLEGPHGWQRLIPLRDGAPPVRSSAPATGALATCAPSPTTGNPP